MSRREHALQRIDLTKSRGLELGPLFDPILRKHEANIFYVDHLSTEDLRKKYSKHKDVPVELIVPTDYPLVENSLKKTLKNKKFDYALASHVIEHIPDTVSWLKDVASVLNDKGIL